MSWSRARWSSGRSRLSASRPKASCPVNFGGSGSIHHSTVLYVGSPGCSMISIDDVKSAYRLILGREPENEEVVADHVRRHRSVAELRAKFLGSVEFRDQIRQLLANPAGSHQQGREEL